MRYTLSYPDASQQYLHIAIRIEGLRGMDVLPLQLPAWRPGRYELGNFAKNIQHFEAQTSRGKALRFQKATKDSWMVQTDGATSVVVKYRYYAAELNAGSTWLDGDMLYVNPVNCLMYRPDAMHSPSVVELKVPKNYEVATGLELVRKHTMKAVDVQQLMDCPFIASNKLQHDTYKTGKYLFHLWFAGECKPDWKRLKTDFAAFSQKQIEAFGDFPVPEYHFLILARPDKVYHGVEHSNSTVISLGPSYALFTDERYYELLAVSSHELYHTWNIKQIRPFEMLPYDFTRENYFRTGYVAEGVTTFMGDLMLVRSGGFSQERFGQELTQFAQRHFDNFGRFHHSVAESSFDMWLDGYTKGVPHRKVSIYNEGALLAVMCDLMLREATGNKHSLDDVMRALYEEYAQQDMGYTEEAYRSLLERFSGRSFKKFFEQYVNGTAGIEKDLKKCLRYVGLELKTDPARLYREHAWGLKAEWSQAKYTVTDIHPGSPAERAGLVYGDELLYFNNYRLDFNIEDWARYFEGEGIMSVKRGASLVQLPIKPDGKVWYKKYTVAKNRKAGKSQRKNYERWTHQKF